MGEKRATVDCGDVTDMVPPLDRCGARHHRHHICTTHVTLMLHVTRKNALHRNRSSPKLIADVRKANVRFTGKYCLGAYNVANDG